MLDIKKKIIAIATICAMAVSMSACSDEDKNESGKSANGTPQKPVVVTASPEEAATMMQDFFEIGEPAADGEGSMMLGQIPGANEVLEQDPVEQDPVEQNQAGQETPADQNQNQANQNQTGQNSADGQMGNNQIVDDDGDAVIDNVDLQIDEVGGDIGGDSQNDNSAVNQEGNGDTGSNSAENPNSNSVATDANTPSATDPNTGAISDGGGSGAPIVETSGAKKLQQAFWMNLNGDFTFEGEFITATFKIKETTANGTYPITVEWLDFANIKGVSLDDVSGVDGSVVVGGAAETNEFGEGFQVKADCVSGNPGDEVTITFQMKENPGICACVFRFGYDSDALEYVSGKKGADFVNAIATQNLKD